VALDVRYNYQTLFLLWQPDEEFKEVGLRVGLYPKGLPIVPKGMEFGVKLALLRKGYVTGKASLKAKIWEEGRKYPGFAMKLYTTTPGTEMEFAGISLLLEKHLASEAIKGVCGLQTGGGLQHMVKPFANCLAAVSFAPFGQRLHIIAEYTGKFNLGTISAGTRCTVFRGLSIAFVWMGNLQTTHDGDKLFDEHYGASASWVFDVWNGSRK
jgi:hypothetical protein